MLRAAVSIHSHHRSKPKPFVSATPIIPPPPGPSFLSYQLRTHRADRHPSRDSAAENKSSARLRASASIFLRQNTLPLQDARNGLPLERNGPKRPTQTTRRVTYTQRHGKKLAYRGSDRVNTRGASCCCCCCCAPDDVFPREQLVCMRVQRSRRGKEEGAGGGLGAVFAGRILISYTRETLFERAI